MQKRLEELLIKRGISEDDFEEFVSPNPKLTYDPFLLKNMEEGANRIIKAIEDGEKICIYGDYDADGVTATVLMSDYLSNFDVDLMQYIPSRFSEGYGLNRDALLELKNCGVDLVITVDCGSVSYDEVEYGKELGLDFVITDHHDISNVIADTIVISPKHPQGEYPFAGLAGVGVAFKTAQALQRKQGASKDYLARLLDLVAIGTIGDIMPMVDENRTLVKYGLKRINENPRIGVRKLLDLTLPGTFLIKSMDLSFKFVPCINAAGRMTSADLAVRLLMSEDEEEAELLAEQLVRNNSERRRVQETSFLRCEEMIEELPEQEDIILLTCDDIHEGIAGIVAGKIKEKYYKPVVLLTDCEEEYYKGTSRGIEGLHLYELLNECAELYERFGGHAGACGFLMRKSNFPEFSKRIAKRAKEMRNSCPEIYEKKSVADMEISIDEINESLVREIDSLEPFGRDFEKPVIMFNADSLADSKRVGNTLSHIRFTAVNKRGKKLSCVKFNAPEEEMENIEIGNKSTVYGCTEINEWKGNRFVQFRVFDISPAL